MDVSLILAVSDHSNPVVGLEQRVTISRSPTSTSSSRLVLLSLANSSHDTSTEASISSSSPALFIVSETHYPGWQATVDGEPAPILRANYVLRAIPVPAGEHTVELEFRPTSFTAGAISSGLALLIIGVGLFLSVRSGRSKESPDNDNSICHALPVDVKWAHGGRQKK